ncbi:MAG: hypothetical protein ACYSWU_11340 [Planctomycetota bacterium]|jgi:hypothetical protein
MRRLIASIIDTITTPLGKRSSGNDVIHLATLRLPAPRFARTLLTWLTGGVPVGAQVVDVGHMRPAVAAHRAARIRRHYCLRTLRPRGRRMEPGSGASLDGS